jgi:16S rRNA (adenine1518-N6/adenine1519-N6)-dimethyltransferase
MLSIAEIIKKYHILANKSLGQNFLMNDEICKKIALAGEVKIDDTIFEVGPGLGSLTRFLIESGAGKVYLIEKDKRFLDILKTEYMGSFEILHTDALKFDFSSYSNFKIIANLPYNIGTELLTRWICLENRPKIMVLMLQKEVVERIISKPKTKDYGRLSVLCQAFYDCEKLFDVARGSFYPAPNVTSSVVRLSSKNLKLDAKKLGIITERLFSSRRKILKNALFSLNIQREDLAQKRAEELLIEDFLSLL